MVFATPLLLLAGALAALVPVLLHFIAPRPPARAPLPTARFLDAEPHTRVRMARTPDESLLMVLRVLLVLLIFMALAGPTLSRTRAGTGNIVLLDAAAPAAADTAGAIADGGEVIAFDNDYAAALRALLAAARTSDTDSVRAWLLTAPQWSAWTPGTSFFRDAWPGSIALVEFEQPAVHAADAAATPLRALVPDTSNALLPAALRATGLIVVSEPSDTGVDVVFGSADPRPGVTVVRQAENAVEGRLTGLHFDDGTALDRAHGAAIMPPPGARIIAAWQTGAPAAAAVASDSGCLVVHGIALTGAHPELPAALARLATGCTPLRDAAGNLPLDSGARGVLAGATMPVAVSVAALPGPPPGRSLTRIVLIVALIVAVVENLLVRRRDGTGGRASGTALP